MSSGMKRITISRSGCNGPCPIYEASITSLGEVIYEGTQFVGRAGKHQWKIAATKVEQLARSFEESMYFSLMDEYMQMEVTCSPGCITSIEYEDGRKKQIDHDFGDSSAPEALILLENKIDQLAGINRYTRAVLSS